MKKSQSNQNNILLGQQSFNSSQSQNSNLPSQWNIVNERLSNLQTIIAKLQKKTIKLQKISKNHNNFEKEIQNQLKKIKQLNLNNELGDHSIRETLFKNIQNDIKNGIKKSISIIQAKTQQTLLKIQQTKFEGLDKILNQKIKELNKKNKLSIQKNIQELKIYLKKYIKQAQLQQKIQNQSNYDQSRASSTNKLSNSKSQRKIGGFRQSLGEEGPKQRNSWVQTNSNYQSSQDTHSRVTYLREKLMEFQKINQKYQQAAEKQQSATKVVQKMKDFRNFLQQSQSSVEPSNLTNQDPGFITTDPLPMKWRNLDMLVKNQTKK